jgi:hypothetical protein
MNDVEAEEERYAAAALLDGNALQAVGLTRLGDKQQAAGLPSAPGSRPDHFVLSTFQNKSTG